METLKNIIYIKLIEGVSFYIPVHAIKLIAEEEILIYKIVEIEEFDEEDFTSIFEFLEGDVVEAIKCNRSGEEIIMAKKMLFSSFKNRKFYELLYVIVNQNGNLFSEQMQFFENEINYLCQFKKGKLHQKFHPTIIKWLEKVKPCKKIH